MVDEDLISQVDVVAVVTLKGLHDHAAWPNRAQEGAEKVLQEGGVGGKAGVESVGEQFCPGPVFG